MKEIKNIKEFKSVKKNDFRYQGLYDRWFYLSYFKGFYKKNKVLFSLTLFLLVLQIIIELCLLVISRNSVNIFKDRSGLLLFFIFLSLFFLLISYLALKKEKTLSVYFANDVRKRIISFYLSRSEFKIGGRTHSDLMAKISYHLPLLSSSFSKVFFAFVRWFFYFVCFVFLVYFLKFKLIYFILFYLFVSVVVFFISYFASRHYISREVTFYSQILKHVSFNILDAQFLKRFSIEGGFLRKFDKLVEFDSYFRIRRDVWFRLAAKIVFLLVIVIYFCFNFWDGGSFNFLYNGDFNYLFFVFLVIYLSRSFYESSIAGLYMYPAKLGIMLSVFPVKRPPKKVDAFIKNSISFHNRKTRLFLEGNYYRRLFFNFEKSKKYLFFGNNFSGKTSLAMVFSSLYTDNPMSWKIKIDGKRFDYSAWKNSRIKPYFFDPNFKSQRTLIEFICGKDKENILMEEIERNIEVVSSFKLIFDNLSTKGNYNMDLSLIFNNSIRSFAAHCAYCLANKPQLIIIDNLWLDLNYELIKEMIILLSEELKSSIFIIFSKEKNEILSYNKEYEITKKEIKEI
ncbi:hypothetical protein CVU82_03205 [Candidatus Falkowbacteria bacterium HGW-Falkowbacteria-1]|uniref:Uncharacterized protein n=1 Tax=Candidatus Falkowbacteria bacterium HGW-Falkowbacteria-1 TaxID=2013768 RepID=A0A2N2E8Q7_9BACT|nr:MAG: hypothetical protein CVU82_03205 [Candidatus Falkowbacteria bacterium HGW-Falkowbacteria-1]